MFEDLRDGRRIERMERRPRTSLTAFIKDSDAVDKSDVENSCYRTMGNVYENTGNKYAKKMGARVVNGRDHGIRTDILFKIGSTWYNIESKSNINLDTEKSDAMQRNIDRKERKISEVFHVAESGETIVSVTVVWDAGDMYEAGRYSHGLVSTSRLIGIKEFFEIFEKNISKEDFRSATQRVWKNEVDRYI